MVKYHCSMVLPWTMKTSRHILELQRICYAAEPESMNNGQVTLYDNIKINTTVKAYWIEQAKKRKYQVELYQLTSTEIEHWTKHDTTPSWKD